MKSIELASPIKPRFTQHNLFRGQNLNRSLEDFDFSVKVLD